MLIPSIDLQAGRVVQLVQGEQLAWSSDDLDGWIEKFAQFPIVQVIDLDAAKNAGGNRDLVRYICKRLPCQVGGGIKTAEAARELLHAGARRVIVGSALFKTDGVNVDAARLMSDAIGSEALIAAIDSRGGKVAVNGWRTTLDLAVADAMAPLAPWVGAFLATLIDGEGKLGGIDMAAATALRDATKKPLIVAGGIRSEAEVERLHALGMDAVVGMAIYRGLIGIQGSGSGVRRSAVIFDFDGVIADSESQHLRAFQTTLAGRGWNLGRSDYYERFLGYSDREVFELLAREHGQSLSIEEVTGLVAAKGRAYTALISDGATLCPGAEAAIRRLAGRFALAIASSAFGYEIVEVLEAKALREFFETIVGAEDVPESKPSPAPYREAARRLAIPSSACVAIEDSPWGLESARRAGLKAIGVTHTYSSDRLGAANVIVNSLDEISEAMIEGLVRT